MTFFPIWRDEQIDANQPSNVEVVGPLYGALFGVSGFFMENLHLFFMGASEDRHVIHVKILPAYGWVPKIVGFPPKIIH